jgi:hypothetical protein
LKERDRDSKRGGEAYQLTIGYQSAAGQIANAQTVLAIEKKGLLKSTEAEGARGRLWEERNFWP